MTRRDAIAKDMNKFVDAMLDDQVTLAEYVQHLFLALIRFKQHKQRRRNGRTRKTK
jgi:hypothetical protein